MDFLRVILLAVLEGLLGFLPFSAEGIGILFYQTPADGIPFPALISSIRLGLLAAALLSMGGSFLSVLRCLFGMLRDLLKNAGTYAHNLRTGDEREYVRVLGDNRKALSLALLIAVLPAVFVTWLLYPVIRDRMTSLLLGAMGYFTSALMLYVMEMADPSVRQAKEVPKARALVIGAAQGASLIPGISPVGMAYTCSRLSGYGKKSAVRTAYLLTVPVYLFASVYTFRHPGTVFAPTGFNLFELILAAVIAFAIGSFMLKRARRLILKHGTGWFARASLAAGVLLIVVYFAKGNRI